jgi:hypothetical protein
MLGLRRGVIAILLLLAWGISGARADNKADHKSDDNVDARLNELEHKQDEIFKQLNSDQGKVGTFLGDKISLGGFFETALTGIWGPQTSTQFSETPTNFALNLAVELSDQVRFDSQTLVTILYPLDNPDNDPNAPSAGLPAFRRYDLATTTFTLPQAFFEFGSSPEMELQVGRGYAPFGIAFQNRDLVLFRRRGGPQMISVNTAGNVVTAVQLWTGAQIQGTLRLKESQWGYHLYSVSPSTDPSSVGGGARLWIDATPQITLGVSDQVFKRQGLTSEAVGADFKFRDGRVGLDAEWVSNYLLSGPGFTTSYYAEPFVSFFENRILVYLAADYLGNPWGLTIGSSSLADPYQRWEWGGGLNWLPYSFTRFRVGVLYSGYVGSTASPRGENRNYVSLDLSAGVEF